MTAPRATAAPAPSYDSFARSATAGWVCLLVGIGLARFGYSALIPELVRQRWFAASAADYLAAVNLAGYLLGAWAAGQLLAHRPVGRWVRVSLLVAAANFWACLRPWGLPWFLLWRLLAGIAAGLLMVLGAPAVLARTAPEHRGRVGGVMFSGMGSGIVISGALVPYLVRWGGLPLAWAGLGALSLLATAVSWRYWRPRPGPTTESLASKSAPVKLTSTLALLMAAYIACAIGFVPHSLFWVDYIARELGRGLAAGGHAYMVLGLSAVVGSPLTGCLGDRFGYRRCLAAGLLLEAVGVALPLLGSATAVLLLSSILVGSTQVSATAMSSAYCAELYPLEAQTRVWGWLTLAFSIAYAGGAGVFSLLFAHLHRYPPLFALAALSLLLASLLARQAKAKNAEQMCRLLNIEYSYGVTPTRNDDSRLEIDGKGSKEVFMTAFQRIGLLFLMLTGGVMGLAAQGAGAAGAAPAPATPSFPAAVPPTCMPGVPCRNPAAGQPWMNTALSPDQRADLVIQQMTLDEKMNFVHGTGSNGLSPGATIPPGSLGGAGFVMGVPRLGIPGINMDDSAVGVRLSAIGSHYATLLPSVLGAAASWDPDALFLFGSVIGRELRNMGYNMSIGGGMDLAREPRNGRNFEYAGEDPLLDGTLVGQLASGVQSQYVMGDIKHYAFNDQETARNFVNAEIDQKDARESDLLAFQIAIGIAHPAGVMCSYNRDTVTPPGGTDWSCENDYLLNQVLKTDFAFKGFVLSDWGGTHSSAKAFMAGLDQEEPSSRYFGNELKQAIQSGQVPMSRLDDAVHRVVRSMFAVGVIDDPPIFQETNPFQGRDDAEHIADEGIVLLKNAGNLLPLSASTVGSVAIIGSHADVAVLSGGGSAQVDAPGGNVVDPHPGGARWMEQVWFPSSPMKEIDKLAPSAHIVFDPGTDPVAAAKLAAASKIAIVFVNQWMSEAMDRATLSLPDNQDALVAAVAAANPRTIVVIESGGPVTMPWAGQVRGIVEAWYPGVGGAQSIADILFGQVDPSGRLPITFPRSDDQLPHPEVAGMQAISQLGRGGPGAPPQAGRGARGAGRSGRGVGRGRFPALDADYSVEGSRVGYKWFESENRTPLFPFGYGLSYTTFRFSGLSIDAGRHTATFTVRNTGSRAGAEVAQVYAVLPASTGESTYRRLVGWNRVTLAPGESKAVTVEMNPLTLSIFDVSKNAFTLVPGDYQILAGGSSADTPLTATMHITE